MTGTVDAPRPHSADSAADAARTRIEASVAGGVPTDRAEPTDGPQMRYDAFLSYSHVADRATAVQIRRALQTLAKPFWKRRVSRVFLDSTSLSASPRLWDSIAGTIDNSRYFVLLASPHAAQSHWVNKEIDHFLASADSTDRVLIALTGGELVWHDETGDFDRSRSDACPPELFGRLDHEPLYVDLRWFGDESSGIGRSARRQRLRNDVATLAAAVRGVDKDSLIGADISRLRRNLALATGALVTVCVLAVLSVVLMQRARVAARQERAQSVAAIAMSETENRLDRSLLLATAARSIAATEGADRALLTTLVEAGPVERFVHDQGSPVRAMAVSDDGSVVVTAGTDGSVAVRDGQLTATVRRVDTGDGDIRSIVFIPESDDVVFGGDNGAVTVLDTASGRIRARAVVSDDRIGAVDTDPAGGIVYVGHWDGHLSVHRVSDLAAVADFDTGLDRIHSVAVSPSGTVALGGRRSPDGDGRIQILDGDTGEVQADSDGWADPVPDLLTVASIDLDPDDPGTLVYGTYGGEVRRWNTADSGGPVTIGRHDRQINRVRFDPAGTRVVSTGFDHTVRIWDPADGTPIGPARTHHGAQVWDAALMPDTDTVISVSEDGTVVRSGVDSNRPAIGRLVRVGQANAISMVEADDRELLALGVGSEVDLIDPISLETTFTLRPAVPTERTILDIVHHDNTVLAAYSRGTVVVWRLEDGSEIERFDTGFSRLYALARHPSGLVVVAGYGDDPTSGELRVFDRQRLEITSRRVSGLDPFTLLDLRFSPDGELLLSGGTPAGSELLTWPDLDPLERRPRDRTSVLGGAFEPGTGELVAIASDRQQVELVDVGDPTLETVATFNGHGDVVFATAFDPSGRLLASAGGDGAIVLWELGTRLAQFGPSLGGHSDDAMTLVFNADGTRLFSGGRRELIVWNLDPERWNAAACRIANRQLGAAEWRAATGIDESPPTTC